MKNIKKLEQINEKIAELQKIQKQLENEFIENMSKEISKILLKKRAFNIDKNLLLQEIENLINRLESGNED